MKNFVKGFFYCFYRGFTLMMIGAICFVMLIQMTDSVTVKKILKKVYETCYQI